MQKKIIVFIFLLFGAVWWWLSTHTSQVSTVVVQQQETKKTMPLQDYLTGVVAAEMPASFEWQALCAQAIAARTYTMEKELSGAHEKSAVCLDSSHCQAYITKQDFLAKNPKNGEQLWTRIADAVVETDGWIMTYESQPIKAVFHAISGGKTENVQEVWGSPLPYLTSVDSATDCQVSSFQATKSITEQEVDRILQNTFAVSPKGTRFGAITRTEAGGVATIEVYGKTIKGTDFRYAFGLRSTHFMIEEEENQITFITYGYGHGVGMSQYGANALASKGWNYRDILRHYYTNITFEKV